MEAHSLNVEIQELAGTVSSIISAFPGSDYYVYERQGTWFIGIDNLDSLHLDSTGTKTSRVRCDETAQELSGDFHDHARAFCAEHHEQGHLIFGFLSFNYSLYTRNSNFEPGKWPLVALTAPRVEVQIAQHRVTITRASEADIGTIYSAITESLAPKPPQKVVPVDVQYHQEEYKKLVTEGLSSIQKGEIRKVILSRQIPVAGEVDMLAALVRGRCSVSPKRTFSMRHSQFQVTGFSPELVMSLKDNILQTEPLAGTRAVQGTKEETMKLREELQSDPKEIVEHVISVKEACKELEQLCQTDTVRIRDFMTVKVRGPVQHLGSTVDGVLPPGKDVWDALRVLFPSITATGIPKDQALDVIDRLEDKPRELYSGAMLLFEGPRDAEACLVLRTIFQHHGKAWTQAGAGILGASSPEREFTETCEKVQTVLPHMISTLP